MHCDLKIHKLMVNNKEQILLKRIAQIFFHFLDLNSYRKSVTLLDVQLNLILQIFLAGGSRWSLILRTFTSRHEIKSVHALSKCDKNTKYSDCI